MYMYLFSLQLAIANGYTDFELWEVYLLDTHAEQSQSTLDLYLLEKNWDKSFSFNLHFEKKFLV